MKNQFDLGDYYLIQDDEKSYWLLNVVLFLVTIGIFIILYKFEFSVFEMQTLVKDGNQFLLTISSENINDIEDIDSIYIKGKKYKFDIIKIDQDYTNINNIIYQTVTIDINKYKTDALVTKSYFLKSKQTIYELFFKFIKGGIG